MAGARKRQPVRVDSHQHARTVANIAAGRADESDSFASTCPDVILCHVGEGRVRTRAIVVRPRPPVSDTVAITSSTVCSSARTTSYHSPTTVAARLARVRSAR